MPNGKLIAAIAVMAVITALLRFLPFLIFKNRKTPRLISYMGDVLPFAIMGMLVVYCLKDLTFTSSSGFMPAIIACAVVVISYILKKNTILSIVGGTVAYMLLIQFVFPV